ncbi:mitochondrial thiamine pyrophosphate transporter [Mycoemilia scoparia]|uniref:Mitochondrial thiamine pyrophosphate transporter n=1 Tax=Mycoemilia scoparia TaxID=417184 RepID=A0A9W8DLY5_9FUNG|nr:mitochondrial thiamine pyrophosphate transporter [Mycoemilia scoparia]
MLHKDSPVSVRTTYTTPPSTTHTGVATASAINNAGGGGSQPDKDALVAMATSNSRVNRPIEARAASGQKLSRNLTDIQSALCGGVAGLVARQLQTQRLGFSIPRYPASGMMSCMHKIVKEEGVKGLFKGNLSAEYLYLTYGGAQFMFYTMYERAMKKTSLPSSLQAFVSGAGAAATATTLTYPLDLLRTRFAAQSAKKRYYTGLSKAIVMIWHDEGAAGFYRGAWAANLQIMPYMGLTFACYSIFGDAYDNARSSLPLNWHILDHWRDFLVGGFAGVASKAGVYPLDLVRKRMQVQGPHRQYLANGGVPMYQQGVFSTLVTIVRYEGVTSLFRGLTPALIKSGPTSAMMFLVYGQMRDFLLWLDNQSKGI